MKNCPGVSALAKELGIDRSNLYEWQRQLEHANESSARVTSPVRELRKEVRELKRVFPGVGSGTWTHLCSYSQSGDAGKDCKTVGGCEEQYCQASGAT